MNLLFKLQVTNNSAVYKKPSSTQYTKNDSIECMKNLETVTVDKLG